MGAKYTMFGFKGWQVATSQKRFAAVLKKHMSRATELNGLVAAKAQREVIQAGGMAKNAPLTIFIKGSSKPLVDHSDLFGGITYEVINEFTVFAGVLRTDEGFNVAVALHEGYEEKVTPAMRGMFLYLWKVSQGVVPASYLSGAAAEIWARRPGQYWPLSDETTVITTPPRPWVRLAFENPTFKHRVQENWDQALVATFRELSGVAKTAPSDVEKLVKKASKAGKKISRIASKLGKLAKKIGKKLSRSVKRATKGLGKRSRRPRSTPTKRGPK